MGREALDFLLSRTVAAGEAAQAAPGPDRAALAELLTAAARVPDHGKLEPWRFVVIAGAAQGRLVAAIRARAAEAGQDGDKGALGLRAGADGRSPSSPSPKASDKIPAIEQTLSGGAVALGLAQRRAGGRLGGELDDRMDGLRPAARRGRRSASRPARR